MAITEPGIQNQKNLDALSLQEKNTNGEVKMSKAEKEKREEAKRANVAAPREALVNKTDDPYGYKNRKKTVSCYNTYSQYVLRS